MIQLGIEMRPLFARQGIMAYPLYFTIGGSFGYWLQGVSVRQDNILQQRREALMAKRRRRDEREQQHQLQGGNGGSETVGILSSTS